MRPHLVRWHKELRRKGLVVIDVNNGAIDTADRLRDEVASAKMPYAVLHDRDAENCKKYGIEGYPVSYLIDVDGNVVWEGFALEKIKRVEETVLKELERVKQEDLPKEEEEE